MLPNLLLAAFTSCLCCALLTPLCAAVAKRSGLIDAPQGRKNHARAIPLFGGCAISLGVAAGILTLESAMGADPPVLLVAGAACLVLVGLLDDIREISPWGRLAVQLAASMAAVVSGVQLDLFGGAVDTALTIVWLVGLTNASNFLDNMDGLAAGLTVIAGIFLALLGVLWESNHAAALAAALAGAAAGFFIHNRHPAKIFMGDMGSYLLGFGLAVATVELHPGPDTSFAWIAPFVVLAVPIFDLALVVLTRLHERRSPFDPGADHISHRLVVAGLEPPRAVAAIHAASVGAGVLALVLAHAPLHVAVIAVAWAVATLCLSSRWFVKLRQRSHQSQGPTGK